MANPEKLILKLNLAAGDSLVLTAALESLHKLYPGKYLTDVDTNVPASFENNPHVTKLDPKDEDVRVLEMHYPVSEADKRPLHFMEGFCEHLGNELQIPLKCVVKHPMIYLSADERQYMRATEQHANFKGRYWIVNAGWKNDYTVKKWRISYFQEVIDYFYGKIQFVQVGEKHQNHPLLKRVINFVGKWDGQPRPLMRLAYHAQGAITPESYVNHIMAAFQKPCICLASGLFPLGWLHYPTTKILSYQSSMSCCGLQGACWKAKIKPLEEKEKSLCELPIINEDPNENVARCMDMIKPEEVIRAVESFYLGGKCMY